ncbi:MMPL family transporter [Nonomuraea sediminis]|uniref:MMPL family transporter n=1 Tax=Nonomuraea sediminis TaxID=2835864 RepID=UPI001BDD135B|nr:MMPL family transporter [Nonomuraea sediminis]
MFASLGRFAARRRRLVVLVTLVLAAVGGVWGTGVFSNVLGGSGFESPSMEAVQVERLMDGPLGRYATDVVVMYESDTLTVDSPAFASAVRRAVGTVPPGAVTRLESYWTTRDPSFVAKDRKATYVVIQLPSSADSERVAQLRALEPGLRAAGLTTSLGGTTSMTMQVNRLAVSDLVRAEALSLPLVLVLLLFVFRGLIPGLVPLAIGLIVIPGALAVLRVVSSFVEMSTYAVNVVSILGLGLAIDYALLMVTRFREELATYPPEEAVWRTMASAGRTVAFSGLTVAASFACLLVFPSRFLVSMAWGGIATVAVAVVVSLTFLPALMRLLGARLVGRSRPPGRRWYGVARAVMRRPLLSTVVIVAALLALATPFLGVNWARPGDWVLPPGAEARHVTEQLAARFTGDPSRAVTGVISSGDVSTYLARFRAVRGVTSAEVTGSYRNLTRVEVRYSVDPMSVAARHMIEDLRATGARFAGMAASRVDIVDMVLSRIPLMALALVAVSFVVLFLAFGSVVLPIKAVLLNLLSLTAAFGAIKLVFQDGWLSGLLGFVPVGAVDINFPVLVVGLALGLAMDYEVFLLARIREEYLRTGDARESVALGLQHTGRVITSAALLMAVVVAGFMTAQITLMLMIGVGLTIAVVVDATVIRALLLPSTMALLGRWAWWAPRPLSRIRTFHPALDGRSR